MGSSWGGDTCGMCLWRDSVQGGISMGLRVWDVSSGGALLG